MKSTTKRNLLMLIILLALSASGLLIWKLSHKEQLFGFSNKYFETVEASNVFSIVPYNSTSATSYIGYNPNGGGGTSNYRPFSVGYFGQELLIGNPSTNSPPTTGFNWTPTSTPSTTYAWRWGIDAVSHAYSSGTSPLPPFGPYEIFAHTADYGFSVAPSQSPVSATAFKITPLGSFGFNTSTPSHVADFTPYRGTELDYTGFTPIPGSLRDDVDIGLYASTSATLIPWTFGVDSSAGQLFSVAQSMSLGTGNVLTVSSTQMSLMPTSSATSTVSYGTSGGTKGTCQKFTDVDGGGYTYCTYNDGVQTCSADSCE